MSGRKGTPVRVRRVSCELRELRDRSGLSAEEVARSLGISMSKLSRMETGARGLYATDVAALLGFYQVPSQRRDELLDLVRHGHDRNWWQVEDGHLPTMWQDLMRFESDAVAIHNWESQFIPGLLQTEEYAEAIIRGTTHDLPDAEVRRLVLARISRQGVFITRNVPEFHVLIDEPVLRRPLHEQGIMERQLKRLVMSLGRPNVVIQVVPLSAGIHTGMEGPFVLLEFASHPSLLYLEHRGNSAFLEQPEHVTAATMALRSLQQLALSPEDSVELISQLADETA